jgi:hypothetical protein
MINPLI